MYIRMRKNKEDEWVKYHINFLDFFTFNLVAGLALGLTSGIIIATIAVLI